jgi:hypothetical protein
MCPVFVKTDVFAKSRFSPGLSNPIKYTWKGSHFDPGPAILAKSSLYIEFRDISAFQGGAEGMMGRTAGLIWMVWCAITSRCEGFSLLERGFGPGFSRRAPSRRGTLNMAFDTFVRARSRFEAQCSVISDKDNLSLSDYMKLPVEQYVCIKMPLDATLERISGTLFDLTVPPVRFFNLEVSPRMICEVSQSDDSVVIRSEQCYLRGSRNVEDLNGRFKFNVLTTFKWTDTPTQKFISSTSKIYVEVDPPAPFKYFGRTVLERTG